MSLDDDARVVGEFLRHGGGWGIGFRVAKWVVALKQGQSLKGANAPLGKVDATTFAGKAGVSKERILRYLRAWNSAADDGLVPHSTDITPDTEWTPDEDQLGDWSHYLRKGTPPKERTPHEQAQVAIGALTAPGADEMTVHEVAESAGVDSDTLAAAAKAVDIAENGKPEPQGKPEDSDIVKLLKTLGQMMKPVLEYADDDFQEIIVKRDEAESVFDILESINQWSESKMKLMESKMHERKLRAV